MNFLWCLAVPCLQCKHFLNTPKDNTFEYGNCRKFLTYVIIARKDESKCGKEGKCFELKDKKD